MKRVLVTGGAGFIGSHLCERLLARGDEVLCVDNFFTSRRQNIAHLRDNPLFEFMRHDITWPLYVEVDRIYNLACPASPVHYQFDPVQTTKTSVHGAINMLGLAKRLKVRILQASTSEVYGDPSQHPQTESYWGNVNPIGPRADYNILIAQADGDSRDRMIGCLNRLGFKFFTSDDHQLRICSKQLAEILAPLGKAGDKYIPRELLRLSRRQSTILLDALILGDGSRRGDTVCYWTKSGRLADDVQELALRCGYAASKSLTPGRDIYRVNLRLPVEAKLVEPERLRYAGKVYCVDVMNHVICVRRHGRAAFCGNCYDEGKRCAETLFFDYLRQHKMEIRVVRIFNTYGPRMHPNDGRVVSNFIVQALKGEPITLYGTGSQSRSFCYVDDLVTGMIAMMDQDELTGPVNLGNPGEFTILELATMVKELTGSKSEIVFKPLPQDDPVRRCPDITLAKAKLHWEPTIPLRDGLARTVAFFRELLAAEK